MKIIKTLLPGRNGTKKYQRKHGDDLVCVRHRYDEELKIKVITIELIVDRFHFQKEKNKISANKVVSVSIDYDESALRKKVKFAAGKWNRQNKLWELKYKDAIELGLADRVVEKD